ncbi:MAG: hypothetical protein M1820_005947 [Bogoriella megaspora]|nr:MAG: hypothetical protein M1820_005947 [Bogoriella megaspora]
MADPLYELLTPYFDSQSSKYQSGLSSVDPVTTGYLNRLSTLSLSDLKDTEPQSLVHASQSNARSLQALSKRSHKSIVVAADRLTDLGGILPLLSSTVQELRDGLPNVENEASKFSQRYSKSLENSSLDRRKKALMLARNADRVSDILEMPTLLSSAISSSTTNVGQAAISSSATASSTNYASALDLHAHIKRLHTLYPNLNVINSITGQAEEEMQSMKAQLIVSLQSPNVKLAGAMRTIGWLRRVAPELDELRSSTAGSSEGTLGALFLACRLSNLLSTMEALDPLKELADQDTSKRLSSSKTGDGKISGHQTERYLKRYIEIFREQSFAIISMYKSIFPSTLPGPAASVETDDLAVKLATPNRRGFGLNEDELPEDLIQPLPSALSTFSLHLVELLMDTLQTYLLNVQDRPSRDSLLTQVLYCAGSLGRLGGDFSMMLALLEESEEDEDAIENEEWVDVMKKHRIQASRLELLASGVGNKNASAAIKNTSPQEDGARQGLPSNGRFLEELDDKSTIDFRRSALGPPTAPPGKGYRRVSDHVPPLELHLPFVQHHPFPFDNGNSQLIATSNSLLFHIRKMAAAASVASSLRPLDPFKEGRYPVSFAGAKRKADFMSLQYNHKPKEARDRQTTLRPVPNDPNSYRLSVQDTSDANSKNNNYEYHGTASSSDDVYAVMFDPETKKCVLAPVSSQYAFNLTSTPQEQETAKLKQRYPQIKATELANLDSDDEDDLFGNGSDAASDAGSDGEPSAFDWRNFIPRQRSTSPNTTPHIRAISASNTPLLSAQRPKPSSASKPTSQPTASKPRKPAASPLVTSRKKSTPPKRDKKAPSASARSAAPPDIRVERRASEYPKPSSPPSTKPSVPEHREPTQSASDRDASGSDDDGDLILDFESPTKEHKRPSAWGLAAAAASDGPISLRSAASSPGSRLGSPAVNPVRRRTPTEVEDEDDGVLEIEDPGAEEEVHKSTMNYDFDDGDEEDDEPDGIGGRDEDEDVDALKLPSPAAGHNSAARTGADTERRELSPPDEMEEDEDVDLEAEMAQALASEDVDEEQEQGTSGVAPESSDEESEAE